MVTGVSARVITPYLFRPRAESIDSPVELARRRPCEQRRRGKMDRRAGTDPWAARPGDAQADGPRAAHPMESGRQSVRGLRRSEWSRRCPSRAKRGRPPC